MIYALVKELACYLDTYGKRKASVKGGFCTNSTPPLTQQQENADCVSGGTNNNTSVSEPVNPGTGSYIVVHHDLTIPGRGIGVEIVLTYDSRSPYHGSFGHGWDFTYDRELFFYTDGTVGLIRGDGGRDYFTPDGHGGYTPEAGVYDTLQGSLDNPWTLTTKDKIVYSFDPAGILRSISDRNGNRVSLEYNTAGQLAGVLYGLL